MDQNGAFSVPERGPRTGPVLDPILVALGSVPAPFWAPFWEPFGLLFGVRFRSFFGRRLGAIWELQNGEAYASYAGSAAWAGGL